MEIKLSYDGKYSLGTGGALIKAQKLLGKSFLVMYGDSYLSVNFKEVTEYFLDIKESGLMTVLRNDLSSEPSNIFFKDKLVLEYDKVTRNKEMKYIDYGLSAFKSEDLSAFNANCFLDLSTILSELAMKKQLAGYEVFERYYEVGSLQGIKDFEELSKELL